MGPDFIIIGAMKCATSTLHEQLARQPGFFMTDPKEPNYFGDDAHFARGPEWYASLFAGSEGAELRGESSTHYTKLPTFPHACARMKEAFPALKLIYMMRQPMERLISQYVHQYSKFEITLPLNEAVEAHPELVDYGRYAMQLAPYLEAYGPESVLPVFVPHFHRDMPAELRRICAFLGYEGQPKRVSDLPPQNVSAERLRLGPLAKFLVDQPLLAAARRALVPHALRDAIKERFRTKERPTLSADHRARIEAIYDRDLASLGARLGVSLTCASFNAVTSARPLDWVR